MEKTYYIWIRATDGTGEYNFFDEVYGTLKDLEEALEFWNNVPGLVVDCVE